MANTLQVDGLVHITGLTQALRVALLLCCFINRRTLKIAPRTLSDVVNRVKLGSHHARRDSCICLISRSGKQSS